MSSYIPTRADARSDPAHRLWFAYVDAMDSLRQDPCVEKVEAIDAAWQAFMADYTRPASVSARQYAGAAP